MKYAFIDITNEYDFLTEWIEALKNTDMAVLVEGSNDKKALEFYNVKNIFRLNKPRYEICEEISYKFKGLIILTDLDKAGIEIHKKMKHDLCQMGVYVEDIFRKQLLRKTKLRQIEGLIRYYNRVR